MKTAEDIVKENPKEIICVSPENTLYEALQLMNEKYIGSVLVKDGDSFVGIWTERDLMEDALLEDFDPRTAKVKDYMTKELVYAEHTDTLYQLIDIFVGRRVRRLPVEKEGKFIGILSAGDVMRATLLEKDNELKELNAMVSWEYYENWRWKKK